MITRARPQEELLFEKDDTDRAFRLNRASRITRDTRFRINPESNDRIAVLVRSIEELSRRVRREETRRLA